MAEKTHVKAASRGSAKHAGMPVYYFNVYNDDVTLDEEGTDLADDLAARAYAIKAARGLAADSASRGHLTVDDRIEIEDADHKLVATVTFGEAVEIR
jgi:hypothetical protein